MRRGEQVVKQGRLWPGTTECVPVNLKVTTSAKITTERIT